MRIVQFTFLVAVVLFVGACATTSGGSQNKSGTITQEEIDASGLVFNNAHEIVRQFRPQWLIKRGKTTIHSGRSGGADALDYVVIYVDDIRSGDPQVLHTISA